MKKVRLAILGLGNVPLAVLRLLQEAGPRRALAESGVELVVTGVTTGSRGNAINDSGIDVAALLALGKRGSVASLNKGPKVLDNLDFIKGVTADVLLVATPASIPSVDEIRQAFARGIHVVTSNKTPVATRYRELTEEAARHGVQFRFGATVLAGYPPWRHFFESVSRPDITEIQIVVNATANQILTMMFDDGKSFEEGVASAQELGIAERDPSDDVDGHDTQKKLAILANALLGADLSPDNIPTTGIRGVDVDELTRADEEDGWIHLLGRAWRDEAGAVRAEVKPTLVTEPFFAGMRGTSMGLYFKTPNAGFGISLDLGGGEKAIMATALGVFEDILTVAKAARR